MTTSTKIRLLDLREIAWSAWDPIGLRGADCPPDEYDAYLLRVAGLLRAGTQRSEAVDYLMDIESRHMGLGERPSSRGRAQETVDQIAKLVDVKSHDSF